MKSLNLFCWILVATLTAANLQAAAPQVPTYIQMAVADSHRPDSDKQRDVNRKPSEVLAFAGVKPGDRIVELMPGRGYFTTLFCKVVGPQGHVYTISVKPVTPMNFPTSDSKPDCDNITADTKLAAELSLPNNLDMVWTSENYHDLHNKLFGAPDMSKFNKIIFDALKPGGVYLVEDHAATAGSGMRDTDTLHRIDAALVKQEVTSVGFILDAESTVLANPNDPRTDKVFALQGKSDKFLLRFKKPMK